MNYIDTETFNDVPIKHGTYKYTSTCEPMIVTYAYGDSPVGCWDVTTGAPMPYDLECILDDDDELLTAHSAMFDRHVLARPPIDRAIRIERWRCTMVKALAHGMPGGLDILCQIFNVKTELRKQKTGRQLINLFCKPQVFKHELKKESYGTTKAYRAAIAEASEAWTGRANRTTHPEQWQDFIDYAINDVAAMREIDRKLPEWNYRDGELALWHLDQKINDRGLCVDVGFAVAAIAAVGEEQARLAARTQTLTAGEVTSTTRRDALLAHVVAAYGVELPDMKMDTVERRLNDPDLPPELRELLAIRLAASSTSTSKYTALVNGAQPDGRLRGTLQFNGAARTRRPAGRTFQPTNLARPDIPNSDIDFGIGAIRAGCADILVDDVMRLCRNAVRGTIIAPPGKQLIIADLANIEGRVGAWFGGEAWKLQAFRDYDDGKGQDLYKIAYAKSFGVRPEEVDDKQRQIGKVEELMLQYEGGVGAFVTGAAVYRIDLEAMANMVLPVLPEEIVYQCKGMWDWSLKTKRNTFGLSQPVFMACDGIKRLWREAHPGVASLWPEMADAVRAAVNNPGTTFPCRMFAMRRDGAWLRIRLPSGNYLCYNSPLVDAKNRISYMGMNQYTRQWSRIHTYGGKLLENACQSFAGDILKYNWAAIEARGYEIVLTVYDENVTEAPDSPEFSWQELAQMMCAKAPYADGLPLSAAGFATHRYRKG